MKKVVLLLVPALVIAGLASVVVAQRPSRYRVERSANSPVAAQALFALASNPRAWQQWSPWLPGTVKMSVVDSRPPSRLTMRLELADPVRTTATSTIELKPGPNRQTVVTWTVEGTLDFTGKAWSLVTNIDADLAPKLDRGLANLSRLSELTRRW